MTADGLLLVFLVLMVTSTRPHGLYVKPHPIRQTTQWDAKETAAVPTVIRTTQWDAKETAAVRVHQTVLVSILLRTMLHFCCWQPGLPILCKRPRLLADSRI